MFKIRQSKTTNQIDVTQFVEEEVVNCASSAWEIILLESGITGEDGRGETAQDPLVHQAQCNLQIDKERLAIKRQGKMEEVMLQGEETIMQMQRARFLSCLLPSQMADMPEPPLQVGIT